MESTLEAEVLWELINVLDLSFHEEEIGWTS